MLKMCAVALLEDPHSGVLQMQKLKTHLLRTQRFCFKPRAGSYVAMHAMPTARDYFHANFYPSDPFTCIFSQNLSYVFARVGCG